MTIADISIHTLCEEGDERQQLYNLWDVNFNPHPLWRGWRHYSYIFYLWFKFQSTPSVKRVTKAIRNFFRFLNISIHTLCEEGDTHPQTSQWINSDFNPHPLWRGWPASNCLADADFLFQSTPSVKRVTTQKGQNDLKTLFQSTPSVKRVTIDWGEQMDTKKISIHTLCEEGDKPRKDKTNWKPYFNPHPLWRGWRSVWFRKARKIVISIHTLCEEGDVEVMEVLAKASHFNPHPLWRGWLQSCHIWCSAQTFQSTPSVKRVTWIMVILSLIIIYFNPHPLWRGWLFDNYVCVFGDFISIHTLCEEGDQLWSFWNSWPLWFQSTPSVKRVTTLETIEIFRIIYFNPHPLWRGWRSFNFNLETAKPISIHTLCEEGDSLPINR